MKEGRNRRRKEEGREREGGWEKEREKAQAEWPQCLGNFLAHKLKNPKSSCLELAGPRASNSDHSTWNHCLSLLAPPPLCGSHFHTAVPLAMDKQRHILQGAVQLNRENQAFLHQAPQSPEGPG